jgi:mono/diheme cytochrome c family protein
MRAFALLSLILAVATLPLHGACRGDFSDQPPIHFNPNMDNQERFDPQEPNPFFKDGLAMRKPVPGTVARGQLRTDTHLHQGRTGADFATTLPAQVILSEPLLARGKERFLIYCAPCHGPLGHGDGVVFRRNAGLPRPANFHDQRVRAMPLGQIVHTIVQGKQNMQRLGFLIPAEDRWAIATYLRALQLSQGGPTLQPNQVQP